MATYAKIEAAEIEPRYARGWHCLGTSSEYTKEPVQLNYFDTKLVAFRGEDDQLIIATGINIAVLVCFIRGGGS